MGKLIIADIQLLKKYLSLPIIFGLIYLLSFQAEGQTVTPWLTTASQTVLFAKQATVNFITGGVVNPATIYLDPSTKYQNIDGFGFCLTEGSAQTISSLAATQQSNLLSNLFDTVSGLGISVLRISIGASDLSSSDYSYDEIASGTDLTMLHFSLTGPDLLYLIPVLKKILAINPNIKILATPWSAPTWMKSNNSFIGGNLNISDYPAYALYFVKYLDEMKAQGINIWAITPQNEPENPYNEPSMSMSSAEETNFINNNLGPALVNAGYTTKIIAYDHNCDDTTYPTYVCKNSAYADGSAFHLYAGSIGALSTVHTATGKNVYFTEQYTAAGGSFSGDLSWHMQNVMIGSVTNWAKTAIEWNLATNSSYGPHTSGGCSTCLGAITVNSSSSYALNVSYYIVAHMAKVVKQNAIRIGSSVNSGATSLVNAAFQNPDGSVGLVVHNKGGSSLGFKVSYGTGSFTYTLAAGAVVSFIWNNGSATGISEEEAEIKQLQVIPNPVDEFLMIPNIEKMEFAEYVIFDISGREELSGKIVKGMDLLEIGVSKLRPGNYIIHLQGKNGEKGLKFVKK